MIRCTLKGELRLYLKKAEEDTMNRALRLLVFAGLLILPRCSSPLAKAPAAIPPPAPLAYWMFSAAASCP